MKTLSTVTVLLLLGSCACAQKKPENLPKPTKVVPAQITSSVNPIASDHIIKNIINNPFLSEDNEYNNEIVPMKFNKNIVFRDVFSDDSDIDFSKFRKIPYPIVYDDQSRYSCYIPIHKSPQDSEPTKEGGSDEVTKEDLVREMVDEILKPMDGKCLFQRNSGWWWYKYCHKKDVVQFHFDAQKKSVGDEYVLGKHDTEASIEDGYEFNLDKMEYSETYTDGTICDLTKKPRTTKVSFVCSPKTFGNGELVNVHEISSCNYHAIIRTPLVCKHSFFKNKVQEEKNAKIKDIICKLEDNDNTIIKENELPGEETCRVKYGENFGRNLEDDAFAAGSTVGGGYPDVSEDVYNGVFSSTEEALKSKEVMDKIKTRMKQLIEEQRKKNGESTDNAEGNIDDIKIVYVNADDLDISYPTGEEKAKKSTMTEEGMGMREERGRKHEKKYERKDQSDFDDDDDDDDSREIVKDEL